MESANYPYYTAVLYDAGILKKIRFGTSDGKKFKILSDCSEAIRRMYKNFPSTKNEQILILEYSAQYKSKIIEICQGDTWISVEEPIKLM